MSQTPQLKRGAWLAPAAALASVIAATSCCLPIGYGLAVLGLVGTGALINSAQPYLLIAAAGLLVFGFVRTYAGKQCRARRSKASVVLLWTASVIVVVLLLFPYMFAGILADLLPAHGSR